MPESGSGAMLRLWDVCRGVDPMERAALLWQWGDPAVTAEACDAATVGARDRALLDIRIEAFGSGGECSVECPRCAEPLEFEVDLRQLRQDAGDSDAFAVDAGEWSAVARVPTCGDVARLGDGGTLQLLAACVRDVRCGGAVRPVQEAPDELLATLEAEMARRDPQAEVQFDLTCPACEHAWSALFDIASWLWVEVDQAARRLMREVDLLARTYHWSEAEIVAMSAARRRAYVEMARA